MYRQSTNAYIQGARVHRFAALLVMTATAFASSAVCVSAADNVASARSTTAEFAENDRQLAARERIEKALASPTECEFPGFPLSDVFATLAAQHEIPIVVDRRALEDEGISGDEPVDVNLRGISLESALNLILEEHGLSFTVRNEVLLVTTPAAEEELLTTKVYPVGDLLPRPDGDGLRIGSGEPDYDELIETITTTVAPTSWDEVGGPGSVKELESTESLVVSTMRHVHRDVEALLAALRRARQDAPAKQATVSYGKPDEHGLLLKLFPVIVPTPRVEKAYSSSDKSDQPAVLVPDPRPTAEQLAEMIEMMIAPGSWVGSGGEGTIHTVSGAIVVRNTQEVLRQVYEVLDAVGALSLSDDYDGSYLTCAVCAEG